jgi:phosphoribosylanthranilate isomerase
MLAAAERAAGKGSAMRVKICGIRNAEEARIAVDSGADALGFLCGLDYPTYDQVDAAAARQIIAALPPFVSSVLVTHRTELAWVAEACREAGCNTIQLHGAFALEDIPALREQAPYLRIIKAVHVVDRSAIAQAVAAARWADAVLLDSRTATRLGGTGVTHDWSISAEIVKETPKPVILAGGLNPENVQRAIETVHPFAVDVNSGVENADGSKSAEKVAALIRRAKGTFDRSADWAAAESGLLAR